MPTVQHRTSQVCPVVWLVTGQASFQPSKDLKNLMRAIKIQRLGGMSCDSVRCCTRRSMQW